MHAAQDVYGYILHMQGRYQNTPVRMDCPAPTYVTCTERSGLDERLSFLHGHHGYHASKLLRHGLLCFLRPASLFSHTTLTLEEYPVRAVGVSQHINCA